MYYYLDKYFFLKNIYLNMYTYHLDTTSYIKLTLGRLSENIDSTIKKINLLLNGIYK